MVQRRADQFRPEGNARCNLGGLGEDLLLLCGLPVRLRRPLGPHGRQQRALRPRVRRVGPRRLLRLLRLVTLHFLAAEGRGRGRPVLP